MLSAGVSASCCFVAPLCVTVAKEHQHCISLASPRLAAVGTSVRVIAAQGDELLGDGRARQVRGTAR